MHDPIANLEQTIRETVERAVRETLAQHMPAIQAYAAQQAKGNSPLLKLRKRAGLNQADLAEACGLNQSSISRIEAGQLRVTREQADTLANVLVSTRRLRGVSAKDLARAIWLVHGGTEPRDATELVDEFAPPFD